MIFPAIKIFMASSGMFQLAIFDDTGVYMGIHMGLSENSAPLHPMVNDHYPY